MNNGMPNFNNQNPGNGPMMDPAQGQAAADLMGGQSSVSGAPNLMGGQAGVDLNPGAMQGVGTVVNQPSVMQGESVVNVPEINSIPGQESSGVNAFTMQTEQPAVETEMSNVSVDANVGTGAVEIPGMQPNMDTQPTVSNDMNIPDVPVATNEAPALNNALMGGGQPDMNVNSLADQPVINNDFGMGAPEMQAPMMPENNMAPMMPENNMEPVMDQQPMNNDFNMNQAAIPDNNMGQPMMGNDFNMNQPEMQTPVMPENNMAPVMDQQPMNNDFNMNQAAMPDNNMGQPMMDNDFGMNQVGMQAPVMNNDQMNYADTPQMNNNFNGGMQQNNMNQNPNAMFQQKKKFPLTVRETILVSIALIGIVVVIGMYGFGWFS